MRAPNMFDTRLSKRTKHRPSNTRTKEMFYTFDRMFDGLQILPNTTKYDQPHDQTRSNSTKQGVQTVKWLVTKQCLMVFGRQTFTVCPGPNASAQPLFSFVLLIKPLVWRRSRCCRRRGLLLTIDCTSIKFTTRSVFVSFL